MKRSKRVEEVAALMGLSLEDVVLPVYEGLEVDVEVGDVVYVTGESGSGKSLLVKHLAEEMARHPDFSPVFHSWKFSPKNSCRKALIDCVGNNVWEAVEVLSSAGLSDVFTWFRRFDELSDGQKMRFVFAKALDSGAKTVVLDEFCSALDRETAKATAYTVQKLARKKGITLVVATAVDDLFEDLNPSLHIVKHFGPHVVVKRHRSVAKPCSLLNKVVVEEGSVDDWRLLSFLHYRSHQVGGAVKIYRAVLSGRVVGVVVYSTPYLRAGGFSAFFNTGWYLRKRFGNVLRVQRIVVHPSFRGIGVARRLLSESMPRLGVAFVEILSSMERLIPFTKGLMKSVVVDVSPQKKELVKEFRELFGIDLMKHGVEEIVYFAVRRKVLGRMRSWLTRNLKSFVDMNVDKMDVAKMLRVVKSSASQKVYGVWINSDEKFRDVVSEALRK